MGGPKTKQASTSNTTNTYGWQAPPDWADLGGLRDFEFQNDPSIPYAFANAKQKLEGTFDNPLGGATTQQIRDSTLRAGYEDIGQQEAQAHREENYGRQALDYSRLADIAQMTSPRMVQTGGNTASSGTSQTSDPLGSIMKGASLGLAAF